MPRPRRIEGYAIVSEEGMLANAAGIMPDSLKFEVDRHFFERGLDGVDVVVHGRHSHERQLDLLEPAHITFTGKDGGELVFVSVEADLDVRYGSRDGSACAEFSWEGSDDNTHASGRGWAALGTAGRLVGQIFIHKGDDSGFVAERE
jgi:hypothetical protein